MNRASRVTTSHLRGGEGSQVRHKESKRGGGQLVGAFLWGWGGDLHQLVNESVTSLALVRLARQLQAMVTHETKGQ
jgi:hypothetical protein